MKPILIVAPHRKIEYASKKVAVNHNDVDVKLALLDKASEICKSIVDQGVEAIISRGGTAKMIEEVVPSIPVVEMPISPYDLLDAIYTAKKYGNNIIIIGFENIIEGVERIAPILDANIRTYHIDHEAEGERYIKQLLTSGEKIDALLGGTVAENLALKYNIPTVLLETGNLVIESSIKEARRLVEVAHKEKEKTQQFKAILHYINEGVISIDHTGKVITLNPAARKILGLSRDEEAINQFIDRYIPYTRLLRVIENNEPELGKLFKIGNSQVLTNRVPIVVKEKTVGAVATFQDITKIQEYEEKIRSKILSKGHVAKYCFTDIIGKSRILIQTKERAKKYAKTDSTVLIVGESGTGKEMFAQSIHLESQRKNDPFVAVNCAAIPQNLLESELFGYEEGAFSGARRQGKSGLFSEAHGGTIFLDEIGEINIELQARLLRVLQEKEIRPIGSNKVLPINVRIIAATNKNLFNEVKKGTFRSDLYYRLNILKLNVPALIERKDDIQLLSKHFIEIISTKYKKNIVMTDEAQYELVEYHWPGNIRELENIIERLIVLSDGTITVGHVEEVIHEYDETDSPSHSSDLLETVKNNHILKILSECKGNQTQAANRLGISRTHLWRILKDLNAEK